jgi:hypothetical protein
MKVSGNIRRAIPIDVSTAQFIDTEGFYVRSGAGVLKYSTYGSAAATSVSRKVASNVATIRTLNAHGLRVGDNVMIKGITTHLEYNGEFTVTGVPTPTTFTYALTHADAAEASDTGGVIDAVLTKTVEEQVYFVDPEVFRKIFIAADGTTATGIHAGYGV